MLNKTTETINQPSFMQKSYLWNILWQTCWDHQVPKETWNLWACVLAVNLAQVRGRTTSTTRGEKKTLKHLCRFFLPRHSCFLALLVGDKPCRFIGSWWERDVAHISESFWGRFWCSVPKRWHPVPEMRGLVPSITQSLIISTHRQSTGSVSPQLLSERYRNFLFKHLQPHFYFFSS